MAGPMPPLDDRPPVGLDPEFVHERAANLKRVRDILGAIDRYTCADAAVPKEWVEELTRRIPGKEIGEYLNFMSRARS